ncbi:hypothetical protein DICA3_C08592 [Diutina catenulata]
MHISSAGQDGWDEASKQPTWVEPVIYITRNSKHCLFMYWQPKGAISIDNFAEFCMDSEASSTLFEEGLRHSMHKAMSMDFDVVMGRPALPSPREPSRWWAKVKRMFTPRKTKVETYAASYITDLSES